MTFQRLISSALILSTLVVGGCAATGSGGSTTPPDPRIVATVQAVTLGSCFVLAEKLSPGQRMQGVAAAGVVAAALRGSTGSELYGRLQTLMGQTDAAPYVPVIAAMIQSAVLWIPQDQRTQEFVDTIVSITNSCGATLATGTRPETA